MPNHADAGVLPEAEFLALKPSDHAARVAAVAAIWPARPLVLDWALGLMTRESPSARNAGRGPDVIARGDITCRVLVIGAGRDGSTVSSQPALAGWPGGECVKFPTAGHDITLERQAWASLRRVIVWLDAPRSRA